MSEKATKRSKYQITVIQDRCKGCQFCIELCPKKTLKQSKDFNRKGYRFVYSESDNDCINCGLCEMVCPDFAITVTSSQEG